MTSPQYVFIAMFYQRNGVKEGRAFSTLDKAMHYLHSNLQEGYIIEDIQLSEEREECHDIFYYGNIRRVIGDCKPIWEGQVSIRKFPLDQ